MVKFNGPETLCLGSRFTIEKSCLMKVFVPNTEKNYGLI